MLDDLDLTATPDDVNCANPSCGRAIWHNEQAFRRGETWLCSMKCVEASRPAAKLAEPDRFAILNAWLDRIGAVPLWQQKVTRVGTVICYRVNARIFLVVRYEKQGARRDGWELFVPASESNKVVDTLTAAALALHCEGP